MAYIIKSDAPLANPANAVGNIHGYYGPSDYKAMLDFTHRVFKVNGIERDFSDVLALSRPSEGRAFDVLGRENVVAAGQPRYHAMPTLRENGLLLENAVTNGADSDADGAAFSVANSSNRICLSWSGSGSVALSATGVAPSGPLREESGRKAQFYSRSGAVTGTINVTGNVSNVMVHNGDYAASYVSHGQSRSADALQVIGDARALVAGGTGSILCRFAFLPDDGISLRNLDALALYNSAAPHGALTAEATYKYNGLGTGEVRAHADNAAINSSTQIARNLGNRNDIAIIGNYFSGFGQSAGVMCYGQAGSDTAANAGATPPTAFDQIHVGNFPAGMVSSSQIPGVVLTHIVIYDRMVSDDEAFDMAVFGSRG